MAKPSFSSSVFALAAFTLLVVACSAHTIKHVIVLMEENRSFDHLLGWRPGVDGVTDKDCNYLHTQNHADGKFCVTKNASNVQKCDPDHDFFPTTVKIYGYPDAHAGNLSNPTMSGFIAFENDRGETKEKNHYCEVMEMFDPKHLPVMNALADDFVLMEKFFCSIPGPTWPNRLFFLTGTSGGLTETSNPWFRGVTGQLYPFRTIFDQVHDAGLSWKNYVNDTPWELMVETVAHNPDHVQLLDEFYKDAREGTLPNFAFINPRAGVNFTHGYGSNDHHPDHDIALGEQYYKDIYEALRASPQWNDTLFIVTYDEHGGFYDHVHPELDIPPPDNYTSWPDEFKFDRGGIRIPTVLISPWVGKNKVEGRPPWRSKPEYNSQYELTSIMATVRKILNISEGPLTKRDAWSATFEHLLDEPSPRTDCPMHLPDSMPPAVNYIDDEAAMPLNSLQKYMARIHGHLSGDELPKEINTQGQISAWLQEQYRVHHERAMPWKKAREAGDHYPVSCQPYIGVSPKPPSWISNWTIPETQGLQFRTVFLKFPTNISDPYGPTEAYCMEAPNASVGGAIRLGKCYSTDPKHNKDRSQLWAMKGDTTLRPFNNQDLCVTNQCTEGKPSNYTTDVSLQPCTGALNQRYAYQGPAPGNMGWVDQGMLSEGDTIWALVAMKKYN